MNKLCCCKIALQPIYHKIVKINLFLPTTTIHVLVYQQSEHSLTTIIAKCYYINYNNRPMDNINPLDVAVAYAIEYTFTMLLTNKIYNPPHPTEHCRNVTFYYIFHGTKRHVPCASFLIKNLFIHILFPWTEVLVLVYIHFPGQRKNITTRECHYHMFVNLSKQQM